LTFYAGSTFFANIAERISVVISGTNAPVLHIEDLLEYIFCASIYYYFFTNKNIKIAIITSIIVITIFAIINAFTWQPLLKAFPTNITLPAFAILTILSLLLFRQMLLSPVNIPLLSQGVFWYNTAILFYSTTLFFIIGLSNYQLRFHGLVKYFFYLWYAILYIFAALLALTLLKASKEINKSHASRRASLIKNLF
jgi:hypothetical protein